MQRCIIRPEKQTRRVDLNYLFEILKSSDASLLSGENQWMFEGKCHFIDSTKGRPDGQNVGFISYPRSGNSFTRRLTEAITGVVSGADQPVLTNTPF
jgi:hypothetical protein